MTQSTTDELIATHGLNEALVRDTQTVEAIVERCNPQMIVHLPAMTQAIVLGAGMRDLRAAMTEKLVRYVFMPLQGTKLGFRTDKDKDGGYPWDIVRDAAMEAMLRGLRPIGNEFNIIGGNCYTTLEGCDRKLAEFPGFTDLILTPGVPHQKDGGALVPYEAEWRLNGKRDSLQCICTTDKDGVVTDRRIPVRVNSGQIVDAILGKAKRKMLGRIYERVSGVKLPGAESEAGDPNVIDTVGVAVEADKRAQGTDAAAEDLIAKHAAKAAKKTEQAKADAEAKGAPKPATKDEPQEREPGDDR